MVKGLYTAYTGMMIEQNRMDILSNNLANSATNGYKKEGSTARAFAAQLALKIKDTSDYNLAKKLGYVNMGTKIGETYTDWSQGNFEVTDNTEDLAIAGAVITISNLSSDLPSLCSIISSINKSASY